jgi:hypothetical protein
VRRQVLIVDEGGCSSTPRVASPAPAPDDDSRPRPTTPAPPLNGRFGGLAMSSPEDEDAASGTNLHTTGKREDRSRELEQRDGDEESRSRVSRLGFMGYLHPRSPVPEKMRQQADNQRLEKRRRVVADRRT